MHPDLNVKDYTLLIDSIEWELTFLREAGWDDCRRYQSLVDIQQRIQQFIDHTSPLRS